jgi:hypothetical protein
MAVERRNSADLWIVLGYLVIDDAPRRNFRPPGCHLGTCPALVAEHCLGTIAGDPA